MPFLAKTAKTTRSTSSLEVQRELESTVPSLLLGQLLPEPSNGCVVHILSSRVSGKIPIVFDTTLNYNSFETSRPMLSRKKCLVMMGRLCVTLLKRAPCLEIYSRFQICSTFTICLNCNQIVVRCHPLCLSAGQCGMLPDFADLKVVCLRYTALWTG
jgi:hypothetical protein